MTLERWERIENLYHAAQEYEESRRSAFLESSCQGDETLRLEVESLISCSRIDGFMESAALEELAPLIVNREDDVPVAASMMGRKVGEYQIVEKLGSGGMGEVYRAVRADEEFQHQVAIKLVKADEDWALIVGRFKNERQILAGLNHPNIARLLDGGTTEEGWPFLVMELIDGQSLDDYCCSHGSTIDERLQLFLQVCSAVQYAHQHLIVHRDVKPSNILVTPEGVPKLLDFGVAKIISSDDHAETTMTVLRALTPAYSSPEQIKGEPVTTASDIFSLGVVLYELLTTRHPFRKPGVRTQEIIHAVTECNPQRPSAAAREAEHLAGRRRVSKRLKGDLDNIILMALNREPEHRYASVERFSDDLQRHLRRLPVHARAGTYSYLASRFVQRHRVGTVTGVFIAAMLLFGAILIVREARIARKERVRAEQRFNDVRKLANSLMFEVHDSIKDLPGATTARKLIVTRALQYVDSLSREAQGDATLEQELAEAYDRLADVQGNPTYANLGDTAGALASYRKALLIREFLVQSSPSDSTLQWGLFGSYYKMGWTLQEASDYEGALTAFHSALEIGERLAGQSHNPEECDRLAGAYWGAAGVLQQTGGYAQALKDYQRAAGVRTAAEGASHAQSTTLRTHLAADYSGMARILSIQGQADSALEFQQKATALLEELSKADTNNATLRKFLADSRYYEGRYLQTRGALREALHEYQEAEHAFQTLSAADPSDTWSRRWLGLAAMQIGNVLVSERKPKAALSSFRSSVTVLEELRQGSPTNLDILVGLAKAYSGRASTYTALASHSRDSNRTKLDYWRGARSDYKESAELWDQVSRQVRDKENRVERDQAVALLMKCDAAINQLTKHPSQSR